MRRGAEFAFVLRVVEVSRSTYYWRQHPDGPRVGRNGGRPIPGVSKTTTGQEVTDEGVKVKLPRFGGQYRTRLQGVDWIFGLS